MQINFNPNVHNAYRQTPQSVDKAQQTQKEANSFQDKIGNFLQDTNDTQQNADNAVQDMLTGKNEDINSVVAAVAKADNSFNLLVGVRNKLIEAYKETMRMQI